MVCIGGFYFILARNCMLGGTYKMDLLLLHDQYGLYGHMRQLALISGAAGNIISNEVAVYPFNRPLIELCFSQGSRQ